MYYSELVKKACLIMYDAHRDDTDRGGYPYVFHPFYVASLLDDEEGCCTALLHDVIEDHSDRYSIEYLREQGFPETVLGALKLLTHDPAVPYMDYVREISENDLALRVKLADLTHNLDTGRTGGVKTSKYDIYREAREYLENVLGERSDNN